MNFWSLIFHPFRSLRELRGAEELRGELQRERQLTQALSSERDALRQKLMETRLEVESVKALGEEEMARIRKEGALREAALNEEIERLKARIREDKEIEREIVLEIEKIEGKLSEGETLKREFEREKFKLEQQLAEARRALRQTRRRQYANPAGDNVRSAVHGGRAEPKPRPDSDNWFQFLPPTI